LIRFEFIVDGPPVSQQTRKTEKLRKWREAVRQEAEKYWSSEQSMTDGYVMVQVIYFYESASLDVDNIVKPIQDALINLVYVDDNQVTDVLVRKRNLSGSFKVDSVSPVLAEGFARGNEFLYIVVLEASEQEVLDVWIQPQP
jgi:crossover junction endodeoxyribonuclease RusA